MKGNEWDDHNRTTCDRIIPDDERPGWAHACGKPTTWLAPFDSELFPLAYCAAHAPPGNQQEGGTG